MPYIGVHYDWHEEEEIVALCALVDELDLPCPVDILRYWGITVDPLMIAYDDRDSRRRCLDFLTRHIADHPWLTNCAGGIADAFGKALKAMLEAKTGKWREDYYQCLLEEDIKSDFPEDYDTAVERFVKNFKGRMTNPLLREPNSQAEPEPESP